MKLLFVAFVGLFLFSCSKVGSSSVEQSSWVATYSVEQQGSKVVCIAKYQVGGTTGTFIELDSQDDAVFCQDQYMTRADSLVGEVIYKAEIKPDTNQNYQIRLSRKDGQYVSQVKLPESIQATSPAYNQILEKNKAFDVIWNLQNASKVSVALKYTIKNKQHPDGEVVYHEKVIEPDTGRTTFSAGETPQTEAGVITPAEIILSRSFSGEMPATLKGSINAIQKSRISVSFK